MNLTAQLKNVLVLFVVLATIFVVLSPVSARTIDEINNDIAVSQAEMAKLKQQLDQANKDLASSQASINSSASEVSKVKAKIAELQISYNMVVLQKQQLEQETNMKNLEKEERQKELDQQIVNSYVSWKADSSSVNMFINSGDVLKTMMYYEFTTDECNNTISALTGELEELDNQTKAYASQITSMDSQMQDLNKEKAFWEDQISKYNAAVAAAKANQSDLQVKSSQAAEQQAAYNVELERAVAAANSGSKPLISGQLYFSGSVSLPRNGVECTGSYKYSGFDPGTDAFGHGIGMSQWGMYGMANAGWAYNKILNFYYQGTGIETRAEKTITVNGSAKMSMETYVSGIGEVPDKACGSSDKIAAWDAFANSQGWAQDDPRRNKYILGNTGCWPEEAIKAQVVAARTYAYKRADSICSSDSCQVYKGGTAKAWAAYETQNQIIVSGGNVIDAFYSGYNNNGHGTADIDTVWPKSSATSYLVSVNDNSITATPKLCNQSVTRQNWRTNSYSISDIQAILKWASSSSNWPDCSNGVEPEKCNAAAAARVLNKIGTLKSLQVQTDASGRAKDVLFVGTNGQSSVSGIFFRMMFNYTSQHTGSNDGLKSITYDIYTAQ